MMCQCTQNMIDWFNNIEQEYNEYSIDIFKDRHSGIAKKYNHDSCVAGLFFSIEDEIKAVSDLAKLGYCFSYIQYDSLSDYKDISIKHRK